MKGRKIGILETSRGNKKFAFQAESFLCNISLQANRIDSSILESVHQKYPNICCMPYHDNKRGQFAVIRWYAWCGVTSQHPSLKSLAQPERPDRVAWKMIGNYSLVLQST